MNKKIKKVLALGAHDDDVLIGIGGILLAKHSGDDIKIQIFTSGENSHLKVLGIYEDPTPKEVAHARRQELEAAYGELKNSGLELAYSQWEYPDTCGALTNAEETIKQRLTSLITSYQPDIIYFQSPDAHEDHRLVHLATTETMQKISYAKETYIYTIWTEEFAKHRPEIDPSLISEISKRPEIIDIRKFIDIKRKALYHFKSQIEIWPYLSWQPQSAPILDASFLRYFLRGEEIITKIEL